MNNLIPFVIQHGYAVLLIWIFAETMGLPLPSAPLLVMVGALAGGGQMNVFLCIGLGVCAALTSDIFWYSMGRRHGGKAIPWFRATARSWCIAPDPTKLPAPGWRYACGKGGLCAFVLSQAAFTPGVITIIL